MEWFARKFEQDLAQENVLDVGSYDVNGSYRNIFESIKAKYKGLDMENGPNVDIVPKSTYNWREISDDTYKAVISGQAIEHIEFFWLTMEEIVRITKEHGLICIIAPNGFKEHRYPVDCWRFFSDGMVALARYFELEIIHCHTNCAPDTNNFEWYSSDCADTMLIARKPYKGKAKKLDLEGYKCKPINQKDILGGFKSYEEHLRNTNVERKEKDPTRDGRRETSMKYRVKSGIREIWSKTKKAIRSIR
tara:strand:+ start:867 stop:1610 length:744 start_codon:yes stop_codon:yes gene_type:complete